MLSRGTTYLVWRRAAFRSHVGVFQVGGLHASIEAAHEGQLEASFS